MVPSTHRLLYKTPQLGLWKALSKGIHAPWVKKNIGSSSLWCRCGDCVAGPFEMSFAWKPVGGATGRPQRHRKGKAVPTGVKGPWLPTQHPQRRSASRPTPPRKKNQHPRHLEPQDSEIATTPKRFHPKAWRSMWLVVSHQPRTRRLCQEPRAVHGSKGSGACRTAELESVLSTL